MIYFLEAVGVDLVKIGTSTQPERRIAGVASVSPIPVRLIKLVAGDRPEERALHRRFDHAREHGEWFRLSTIRDEIEAINSVEAVDPHRCPDCGLVTRTTSRRTSHKRCRGCAAKKRTREKRVDVSFACAACGKTKTFTASAQRRGRPPSPLCQPCGMRAAWDDPSYRSSVTAARRDARRRRASLSEPGLNTFGGPVAYGAAASAADTSKEPEKQG